MANFDNIIENIIERIISEYTTEIKLDDRQKMLVSSVGATPSIALENYKRQKQPNNAHKEQLDTLRRVLRRVLGTEEQLKEIMRPTAEKVIREAIEKFKNGLGGLTINLQF